MAWTKAVTLLSPRWAFKRGDGTELYCFQLDVTSDASSSGDITLSTELTTTYGAKESERMMEKIEGSSLHWITYIAGSVTPTTASTITVDDQLGLLLFSEAVSVAGTDQAWAGIKDTVDAPLTDAIIAMTTLANEKTATVYFWFKR